MSITQRPRPQLKIDKHLPQVVVPEKARNMFKEWWNTDIRFEKTIPHSFESGYIILEYNYMKDIDYILKQNNNSIKEIAKTYKTTFRNAEDMFKNLLNSLSKFTIYFKFKSENAMWVDIYDNTNQQFFTIDFAVGESEPEPEVSNIDIFSWATVDDNASIETFVKDLLYILVTTLWYIATTKSTKYIYEKKTPVVTSRHKNVVKVSDTKTINTPIYDLNKIRVVKVEHLQTRKKGWTYSHSFQVHGHYRHYQSGKTIFIQPYIKGKEKEFKQQTIIIDPKQI